MGPHVCRFVYYAAPREGAFFLGAALRKNMGSHACVRKFICQ